MEYLTLPQPLPVWVPVYDVKLEFQIGKLGDKLDALPLLILFMIDDRKSLEDIVMVTNWERLYSERNPADAEIWLITI